MSTYTQIQPAFKQCKENVEVPTILVEPFEPGGESQVWIQWFGNSRQASLENMQFRFPVPMKVNAPDWFGHPEKFKVILLGPIVDYPNREYGMYFAKKYLKGDPDGRVVYVISSHVGVDGGNNDTVPIAFLIPMTIELLDDMVGIISPKKFYSFETQQKVIDEFYKKQN